MKCCNQYPTHFGTSRPGEAYIVRIRDDPRAGYDYVQQLEELREIRDRTVKRGALPAVMMGDFNVHHSLYGIMDGIFQKVGAVDVYRAVHRSVPPGGETVNWYRNRLHQIFSPGERACDPDEAPTKCEEGLFDRIDYVYLKENGDRLRLVPTNARVIEDWKYDHGQDVGLDLSDHYPLEVQMTLQTRGPHRGRIPTRGRLPAVGVGSE
jgi:endonuclease/exonuclease/phosphatase family metal-dependent hydrolase